MADDERLNPLPVQPRDAPISKLEIYQEDGASALGWTLLAVLAPLAFDSIFTGVIGERPFYSISIFHIGLCLFGISLAALVRILGHGRGKSVLPFLLFAVIVEVVLAFYFGGTFSHQEIDRTRLDTDIETMESAAFRPTDLPPRALEAVHHDLRSVQEAEPEPNTGAYVVLVAFGVISLLILVRYWSPPIPSEQMQHEGQNGT